MAHRLLWVAVLVAVVIAHVTAFKAEDFKKCQDSGFCTRLRGTNSTDAFVVVADSVAVEGPVVRAKLVNRQDANGTFYLTLTAYADTVRLHIDEDPAKKRFQVPDVLLPSFEGLKQRWEVVKKTGTKLRLQLARPSAAQQAQQQGSGSAVDVELRYAPAQLEVSVGGQPVLVWNDNRQFVFEHLREQQESDPTEWWSESFKSHHDSKPKGPEAVSFDVLFPGVQHVYGIPERATSLSLEPTTGPEGVLSEPYRLYNLDVFEYLTKSPFGLYGAIPLMLAHRVGQSVGLFWLNAAEMYIDVSKSERGTSAHWFAESGVLDLFVLLGPAPADISRQYALLTGGAALPQIFSLGYHQCRWNYRDEADVAAVDGGFDAHNIPYDVIWLDIEHTDGKRYFTWDKNYFPTPIEMQKDVASRGRKMVTIVDPHIKRDSAYKVFKEAEEKGLYVKNKEGADFDGWCWPGSSSYLDMTNPAVRDWWAGRFSTAAYEGSTPDLYIWNDMNEPSVFNGPEITMHKDLIHHGGYEHRDVHNVYGYFYHMATADGLRRRGLAEGGPDGDRPFVLSRAFFAGSQRLGAIWTGDNAASWEHLAASVPMLLSINLGGLQFAGADVGGFFGNPEPELLVRWYQLGAYYPFFRGHAHLESKRREPWLFGEESTARIRDAIRQRYRLLPYLYTLFLHANGTGAPVMRPLFYEFPQDQEAFAEDANFMLGPSILVAPVTSAGAPSVDVFLPGGDYWFDGQTGAFIDASVEGSRRFSVPVTMDAIPTYLRGGTMLPLKERPRRSTAAMATDSITLIILLDRHGKSRGELYLDDGKSYAFQRGAYAYRALTADTLGSGQIRSAAADHAAVLLPPPLAGYDPQVQIEKIVVVGLPGGAHLWAAYLPSNPPVALEAAPGPLFNRPGLPANALVIRRPGLAARDDWTVQLWQPHLQAQQAQHGQQ